MPTTPHTEKHFTASATVRDIVIGMADGLTVPFALAAGLSGAVDHSNIIVTAGLAEIAAGSIAMGLGGYLAAKSDRDHYLSEMEREKREIKEIPQEERKEVAEVFKAYGLEMAEINPILDALEKKPDAWVDFMMRFELGLEEPDPKRAMTSAFTIGLAYIGGGLVPLLPYILMSTAAQALNVSVIVTLLALFLFGMVKGKLTGVHPMMSGLKTMLIGGLAAAAAFGIAKAIS